eukprot:ctg_101.g44
MNAHTPSGWAQVGTLLDARLFQRWLPGLASVDDDQEVHDVLDEVQALLLRRTYPVVGNNSRAAADASAQATAPSNVVALGDGLAVRLGELLAAERALVAAVGHSSDDVRDRAVVLLNVLYDGHPLQLAGDPLPPVVQTVGHAPTVCIPFNSEEDCEAFDVDSALVYVFMPAADDGPGTADESPAPTPADGPASSRSDRHGLVNGPPSSARAKSTWSAQDASERGASAAAASSPPPSTRAERGVPSGCRAMWRASHGHWQCHRITVYDQCLMVHLPPFAQPGFYDAPLPGAARGCLRVHPPPAAGCAGGPDVEPGGGEPESRRLQVRAQLGHRLPELPGRAAVAASAARRDADLPGAVRHLQRHPRRRPPGAAAAGGRLARRGQGGAAIALLWAGGCVDPGVRFCGSADQSEGRASDSVGGADADESAQRHGFPTAARPLHRATPRLPLAPPVRAAGGPGERRMGSRDRRVAVTRQFRPRARAAAAAGRRRHHRSLSERLPGAASRREGAHTAHRGGSGGASHHSGWSGALPASLRRGPPTPPGGDRGLDGPGVAGALAPPLRPQRLRAPGGRQAASAGVTASGHRLSRGAVGGHRPAQLPPRGDMVLARRRRDRHGGAVRGARRAAGQCPVCPVHSAAGRGGAEPHGQRQPAALLAGGTRVWGCGAAQRRRRLLEHRCGRRRVRQPAAGQAGARAVGDRCGVRADRRVALSPRAQPDRQRLSAAHHAHRGAAGGHIGQVAAAGRLGARAGAGTVPDGGCAGAPVPQRPARHTERRHHGERHLHRHLALSQCIVRTARLARRRPALLLAGAADAAVGRGGRPGDAHQYGHGVRRGGRRNQSGSGAAQVAAAAHVGHAPRCERRHRHEFVVVAAEPHGGREEAEAGGIARGRPLQALRGGPAGDAARRAETADGSGSGHGGRHRYDALALHGRHAESVDPVGVRRRSAPTGSGRGGHASVARARPGLRHSPHPRALRPSTAAAQPVCGAARGLHGGADGERTRQVAGVCVCAFHRRAGAAGVYERARRGGWRGFWCAAVAAGGFAPAGGGAGARRGGARGVRPGGAAVSAVLPGAAAAGDVPAGAPAHVGITAGGRRRDAAGSARQLVRRPPGAPLFHADRLCTGAAAAVRGSGVDGGGGLGRGALPDAAVSAALLDAGWRERVPASGFCSSVRRAPHRLPDVHVHCGRACGAGPGACRPLRQPHGPDRIVQPGAGTFLDGRRPGYHDRRAVQRTGGPRAGGVRDHAVLHLQPQGRDALPGARWHPLEPQRGRAHRERGRGDAGRVRGPRERRQPDLFRESHLLSPRVPGSGSQARATEMLVVADRRVFHQRAAGQSGRRLLPDAVGVRARRHRAAGVFRGRHAGGRLSHRRPARHRHRVGPGGADRLRFRVQRVQSGRFPGGL